MPRIQTYGGIKMRRVRVPQTYVRRLQKQHTSILLILPSKLLDRLRRKRGDLSWDAGDLVKVGLTESGKLVVELMPMSVGGYTPEERFVEDRMEYETAERLNQEKAEKRRKSEAKKHGPGEVVGKKTRHGIRMRVYDAEKGEIK